MLYKFGAWVRYFAFLRDINHTRANLVSIKLSMIASGGPPVMTTQVRLAYRRCYLYFSNAVYVTSTNLESEMI